MFRRLRDWWTRPSWDAYVAEFESAVRQFSRAEDLEERLMALSDANVRLLSELGEANHEIAKNKADIEAAAGELLVSIPQPGTDAARLLHANVMMRQYHIPELRDQIARLEAQEAHLEAILAGAGIPF